MAMLNNQRVNIMFWMINPFPLTLNSGNRGKKKVGDENIYGWDHWNMGGFQYEREMGLLALSPSTSYIITIHFLSNYL